MKPVVAAYGAFARFEPTNVPLVGIETQREHGHYFASSLMGMAWLHQLRKFSILCINFCRAGFLKLKGRERFTRKRR